MDPIYAFDANRFRLGTLCKHGHSWPGTTQSLRRIHATAPACAGCTGRKDSSWLLSFLDYEAMGWPLGHRLGKLCTRGHRYENLDVTLRINRRCKECDQEKRNSFVSVAWRKANKEKLSKDATARAARRMAEDPEGERRKLKERHQKRVEAGKVREYKAKYRETLKAQGLTSRGTQPVHTPEKALQRGLERAIRSAGRSSIPRLVMNEQLRYWRENPEEKRLHDAQWDQAKWWLKYQINPELRIYHREKSKRRKAQARGQTPVQISVAAIRQRFNEFGNCCAYCGDGGDMQIEHVDPISKGGAHDIGNIVPACSRCNTSKGNREMEEWYRSQSFFSELRLHRIRRVMRQPEAYQLAMM